MMTQQEIYSQAVALPMKERAELLKKLEKSLKNEHADNSTPPINLDRDEVIAERKRAVDRLRGIASVPGKKPPTDEEWREERTNCLLEK